MLISIDRQRRLSAPMAGYRPVASPNLARELIANLRFYDGHPSLALLPEIGHSIDVGNGRGSFTFDEVFFGDTFALFKVHELYWIWKWVAVPVPDRANNRSFLGRKFRHTFLAKSGTTLSWNRLHVMRRGDTSTVSKQEEIVGETLQDHLWEEQITLTTCTWSQRWKWRI